MCGEHMVGGRVVVAGSGDLVISTSMWDVCLCDAVCCSDLEANQ